jgi:addiction module HigA family antidote
MSESKGSVGYDAWLRRHPSHPGRHIYHGCMEDPLGESSLTVSEAAHKLGVSRVALSRVLNGRASISVSLALKLEAVGWGTADVWLRRQAQYDLARERNRLGQWPGRVSDPEDTEIAAEAA